MLVREISESEKTQMNSVATHPLQTWEWGQFRKKTGVKVKRLGIFEEGKLVGAFQITFHQIPVIGQYAGYLPRGPQPTVEQLDLLKDFLERENALFIKLEPAVWENVSSEPNFQQLDTLLKNAGALPGRPLFTRFSFRLDLTPSEEDLFANLASKTRYNVRLADKKGVEIFENTTAAGMEEYLSILAETTKRQEFYAHSPEYFRLMWQELGKTGMLRIFQAKYQDQVLATWIVFVHNHTLYYPYGASRSAHRNVMASNLLMWEVIRFGKKVGCTEFDMWGSLGPNPSKKHPWYGFHRFKQGYGGQLVQYLGTYDLTTNQPMYKLFTLAESLRWKLLRAKAKLGMS